MSNFCSCFCCWFIHSTCERTNNHQVYILANQLALLIVCKSTLALFELLLVAMQLASYNVLGFSMLTQTYAISSLHTPTITKQLQGEFKTREAFLEITVDYCIFSQLAMQLCQVVTCTYLHGYCGLLYRLACYHTCDSQKQCSVYSGRFRELGGAGYSPLCNLKGCKRLFVAQQLFILLI